MTEYKRILDSVHGYINIPCLYCDNIIDTIYFQRLRRIEQTSGRSLFPSAHHDRFIHSLGVYHLGQKIVDSIKRRYKGKQFTDYDDVVYESYILACLLHDVCHSPFSHTFENFYEKGNDLRGILIEAMKNDEFTSDWNSCFENCAPHEIMSAYLTLQVFSDWITNNTKANIQLIVRMIIGCKFIQSYQTKSFENSFIDLIHGDIIDADGLDYACRDAWASGYCTNNIDVDRLIDSIHIEKNAENLYTVCYTTKAQNEIEAVLNVKSFQQINVITHHTVVYEQALLIKAMESAALFHCMGIKDNEDEEIRTKALCKLCNINSFFTSIKFDHSSASIIYPMDDDFVSLMKYIPDDRYVKQWISRKYELKALWKSKADFLNMFDILIDKKYTKNNWLFSDYAKKFICETFELDLSSVWILPATSKYKLNLASKVNLFIDGKILPYTELFKNDKNSFTPDLQPFSYIYVPQSCDTDLIIRKLEEQVKLYFFN